MISWRGPGHPRAGGAELYTERVLCGLAARGHRVTWLCEGGAAPGLSVVARHGWLGLHLAARRLLRAHPPGFEVAIDQINVLGFLTPLFSPVPVVALIHQRAAEVWRYDGPTLLRAVGPALEAALLRCYRRVPFVTVSRTTLAELRERGWRGPGTLAFNGLDAPAPGAVPPAKEPGPTLVFLGRLGAASKRLPHALHAFAQVRRSLPAARLWVIGRGVAPSRAPDGVTFHLGVSAARRDELLARAWLLVATSVREGWGRMVLEAAAAGTPALVYAVPGLAEAAGAAAGACVAPDPAALAAAALALLAEPEALHRRGRQARQAVAGFTWDAAVEAWEAALHAAATPGRGPAGPAAPPPEPPARGG